MKRALQWPNLAPQPCRAFFLLPEERMPGPNHPAPVGADAPVRTTRPPRRQRSIAEAAAADQAR